MGVLYHILPGEPTRCIHFVRHKKTTAADAAVAIVFFYASGRDPGAVVSAVQGQTPDGCSSKQLVPCFETSLVGGYELRFCGKDLRDGVKHDLLGEDA